MTRNAKRLRLVGLAVCAAVVLCCAAFFRAGVQTRFPADYLQGAQEWVGADRPSRCIAVTKTYYRDRQRVGERRFYPNGQLAEERLFKDGHPYGTSRRFYQSGKLFSALPYRDGVLDGVARFCREDGTILGESSFVRGDGVLRQFALDSLMLPAMELPYRQGLLHGNVFQWAHFRGGQGMGCSITQYEKGLKEGWSITFNEDGSVLDSGFYRHDQAHGVFRMFTPEGEPEKGYPMFFVNDRQVTEEQYNQAAATDETLAQTRKDNAGKEMRSLLRFPPLTHNPL